MRILGSVSGILEGRKFWEHECSDTALCLGQSGASGCSMSFFGVWIKGMGAVPRNSRWRKLGSSLRDPGMKVLGSIQKSPVFEEFGPVSGTTGWGKGYASVQRNGGFMPSSPFPRWGKHRTCPEKLGVRGYGAVPRKSGMRSRVMPWRGRVVGWPGACCPAFIWHFPGVAREIQLWKQAERNTIRNLALWNSQHLPQCPSYVLISWDAGPRWQQYLQPVRAGTGSTGGWQSMACSALRSWPRLSAMLRLSSGGYQVCTSLPSCASCGPRTACCRSHLTLARSPSGALPWAWSPSEVPPAPRGTHQPAPHS